MIRTCVTAAVAATLLLPAAAGAQTTIGTADAPADGIGGPCSERWVVVQTVRPPGVTYTVPNGIGEIYQWRVNTAGAPAGRRVEFVVLRPTGAGYTVVGTDSRVVPAEPGPGDVATYALDDPIAVHGGEVIAIRAENGVDCFWYSPGAATGRYAGLPGPDDLAPGQTLTPTYESQTVSRVVNVAASVRAVQDVGVAPRGAASAAYAGVMTSLHASVTNRGPGQEAIAFTDVVADGLAVRWAVAGAGRCRVEGQTVQCVITGVAAGETVPVVIAVVPAAAGTYPHSAWVSPAEGGRDPDPSNDVGAAYMTVRELPKPSAADRGGGDTGGGGTEGGGSPPPATSAARCVVPVLRGTPLRVAQELLGELGCTVGKVKRVRSRKVRKGTVIRTSPGASTQPAGAAVELRVSRGPRRRR